MKTHKELEKEIIGDFDIKVAEKRNILLEVGYAPNIPILFEETEVREIIFSFLRRQREWFIELCEEMKKRPTEDQEYGLEYDEGFDSALENIKSELKIN